MCFLGQISINQIPPGTAVLADSCWQSRTLLGKERSEACNSRTTLAPCGISSPHHPKKKRSGLSFLLFCVFFTFFSPPFSAAFSKSTAHGTPRCPTASPLASHFLSRPCLLCPGGRSRGIAARLASVLSGRDANANGECKSGFSPPVC